MVITVTSTTNSQYDIFPMSPPQLGLLLTKKNKVAKHAVSQNYFYF